MHESKVILVLKSFTSSELQEFYKFITSPFFNKKEEVIKMYSILRKAAPEFLNKKIDRAYVMKKVFPNLKYDEKKYKYLSNLLLKALERYISLKETESRPMIQEYHLLNAYVKRGIDKNFNFIYNKAKNTQSSSSRKDANFYYREYLLKNVAAEHFDKKKVRKNNEHLEELLQALDLYYLANKLKYTCHILNNKKIISSETDTYLPEEIIHLLNHNDFSKYPAINLYFTLYKLVTKESEDEFNILKELLQKYNDNFSREELKEIYYYIINFCITQLTKNNKTTYYLTELYKIYKNGISTNLLLDDGFLSPWTYKNVIKIGLRLEKYNETENFIKESKKRLKKEFQSDAYNYNLAELYYRKKNYEKSLTHLNHVEYSDLYYILGSKKLLLKIYYEANEYDALESLLNSFQTYLKRNKLISEENRIAYLNFTKLLWKVLKNENGASSLEHEINQTTPLVEKTWLMNL